MLLNKIKVRIIPYTLTFLFGGIIMIAIYIAINEYNNGAVSAIIAALPMCLMCCYIINNRELLLKHGYNLIPVILLTVLTICVLIYFIKYTKYSIITSVTIILILWVILQFSRIKLLEFYNML